ncbi:LPXTG-motif cell wall-anchored protein, partial [Streptococcus loxodontisalivarius]
ESTTTTTESTTEPTTTTTESTTESTTTTTESTTEPTTTTTESTTESTTTTTESTTEPTTVLPGKDGSNKGGKTPVKSNKKSSLPSTGESTTLWSSILGLLIIGLSVSGFIYLKSKKS